MDCVAESKENALSVLLNVFVRLSVPGNMWLTDWPVGETFVFISASFFPKTIYVLCAMKRRHWSSAFL